ncbi:MAG: cation:proton antiporter [Nanobdellota archaeon]
MTDIFFQIGIVIVMATFLSFLARKLKQPMIPAYIFAGILVGPILGIVRDSSELVELAEIGVAFLLFVVGLELNFEKLKNISKVASVGATLQILFLFFAGLFFGNMLGFGITESIYIGLIVSFSSTMVVVKLLSDKSELNTLHGKIMIGFLLIQDFFAIIALSTLNTIENFSPVFFIVALLKTALLLLISYFMNGYLFRPLFRFAAKTQELLFLVSLSACFFFAFLFKHFGKLLIQFSNIIGLNLSNFWVGLLEPGLSIAMGAFIAGIGLASMPYAYEVIGKVRSLRDFFATIFFISLGVQLSHAHIELLPILALIFLVLVLKPVVTFFIVLFFSYTKKTSFETATTLAQSSEFSLIIVGAGVTYGHIGNDFLTMVVILTLVSILSTSYTVKYNRKLYRLLYPLLDYFEKSKRRHEHKKMEYMPKKEIKNEVLLIGFDRIGYSIYETLKRLRKRFLIVDFNPDIIQKLIKERIHCIYGDIADEEIVERSGLEHASIIISTIPDIETTKFMIDKARKLNPHCTIIVTAYDVKESLELYDKGADYVILPHLLGGQHASLILEEFNKDFRYLIRAKVRHIEQLNKHLDMGHKTSTKQRR